MNRTEINELLDSTSLYFRSHKKEDIAAALTAGQYVWIWDSNGNGTDDVLLGESAEDVLDDLRDWYDPGELPEGATLAEWRGYWGGRML